MKIRVGYFLLSLGLIIIIVGFVILGIIKANPTFFTSYKFINQHIIPNLKTFEAIGFFIGILGTLSQFFGVSFNNIASKVFGRKPTPRATSNYFPFHIITKRDDVLPSLLSSPGLIPDHEIPYQYRLPDRKITEELRAILMRDKKILVAGLAGIGKTREAGKLLLELVDEGYTVLLATTNARFDLPINFPDGIRSRLIFVFDDIHQYCSVPPSGSLSESISTEVYLDNLSTFLSKSQSRFTSSEIQTIFISRKDKETWERILYPNHKVWFDTNLYELPLPDLESQKKLVLDLSERLDMNIEEADAYEIASANDGTFRNLIQNLYRSKRENYKLGINNFFAKQGLTWNDLYQDLCKRYKGVEHFLEALSILEEINIPKYLNLAIYLSNRLDRAIFFGED